jgi:nitrogen PTS system EIIA component
MLMSDILTPTAVFPTLRATSKKQVLQILSRQAAALSGLEPDTILTALLAREKAGTTALGGGVAIPHGRMATLGRPFAVFAHIETPVDFEALDAGPVDLVAVLLSPLPETAGAGPLHLKALAALSRCLRDRSLCDRLRGCRDSDAAYALLTAGDARRAA